MRFKLLENGKGFVREFCGDGIGYIVEYQNGDYDALSEEWVKKNIKDCANAVVDKGKIISCILDGFNLMDYHVNRKIRTAIRFYRILAVYGFTLEYKNSTLYVDGKPIRKQRSGLVSRSNNRFLVNEYLDINKVLNGLIYTLYIKPAFRKDYRILTFARDNQVRYLLEDVSASLDLSGQSITRLKEYGMSVEDIINPNTNENVLRAIDKSCEKIR